MKSKKNGTGTSLPARMQGVAAILVALGDQGFSGRAMLSRANILAAFERGLPGRADA